MSISHMSDTSAFTTWFQDSTKRKLDQLNAAFAQEDKGTITRKKIIMLPNKKKKIEPSAGGEQVTDTDEMKGGTMATMGKSAYTDIATSGQIYEETSKDTRKQHSPGAEASGRAGRKRQQEMMQEGAAAALRFLAQTQKCVE